MFSLESQAEQLLVPEIQGLRFCPRYRSLFEVSSESHSPTEDNLFNLEPNKNRELLCLAFLH